LLLCFAVPAEAASRSKSKLKIDPREQGQVVRKDITDGSYLQYIPSRPVAPPQMLVLVHGSLGPGETVLNGDLINRWIPFAEEMGLILITPAFDQENYGGEGGPAGGYRGLFGRKVRADEFLNSIINQYQLLSDKFDGRFYLYGHSAGGQFAGRYMVMHPDRILGGVISAAGSFAYPNPDWAWGNGMGPLKRAMRWPGADKDTLVDIKPDPVGWVKAGGLPISIVVGAIDLDLTADYSKKSDQKGDNHVERAQSWFEDMKELCKKHKQAFHMQLVIVPKAGHSSRGLTPASMRAIADAIAFNRRQPASRPAKK
jgi:pimeloyl-ACP methyl ester carboxylesterase